MATSTASSPSFLAGLMGAPSSSRRVCESSGLAVRRDLMVAASRNNTSLVISWDIHCRDPRGNRHVQVILIKLGAAARFRGRPTPQCDTVVLAVEPHGETGGGHMALGLADRMLAIVED